MSDESDRKLLKRGRQRRNCIFKRLSPRFNYKKPHQIKTRRQKSVPCFFADSTSFTAKSGSRNILEPLSIGYLSHHAGRSRPQPIGGQQPMLSQSAGSSPYAQPAYWRMLSPSFSSTLCMQQKPLICFGEDKPICLQTQNSEPRLSKAWLYCGPRGSQSLNISSLACS